MTIPQWTSPEPPIKIPVWLYDQLEECRTSGDCNMLDRPCVVGWMFEHDYFEAAIWVDTEPDYPKGIFYGFEPIEE